MGRSANLAASICPRRIGVGKVSEPGEHAGARLERDAACPQVRERLGDDRQRIASVGAGIRLDGWAAVDPRLYLHGLEGQVPPPLDGRTEHRRSGASVVGDAVERGCGAVAGSGRVAGRGKLDRGMKGQRAREPARLDRRVVRRQVPRELEGELALDLRAMEQAGRNAGGAFEASILEDAARQRPVMAFEELDGAHGRADLPAGDAPADQLRHPILDRVGLAPAGRFLSRRRERDGAPAPPGFRQVSREPVELLVHQNASLWRRRPAGPHGRARTRIRLF